MCEVSIIIPIYNGEKELKQCLDSVINQDIISKEIICVDDGSVDASASIVRQYQSQYSYIKLIEQINQGAAIARNNALAIASGKYIAFMDSDDFYIDKTGLRKMIQACEDNHSLICGSFRMSLKNEKMTLADTYSYRDIFDEKKTVMRFKYIDFQYDYHYQSYIFKKSLLDEYSIRFPNLRRYQDPPFFVKAMWYAKEFLVVPIELYCYRSRPSAMKYSFRQINDTLRGIKSNLLFAKENGLKQLYINNRNRLNKDFYYIINHSIEEGNLEILKLLVEISDITDDVKFVPDEEKFTISSIEHMQDIFRRSRMVGNWSYKFPYAQIPYGSKIVLYGAGNVGKTMYSIVENTGYCNIVDWVDMQYEKYRKDGLPVNPPEGIINEKFDYIIVSVENIQLYDEIRQSIVLKKWNKEKEIVGPIEKMR